jgi:hypothetical protein
VSNIFHPIKLAKSYAAVLYKAAFICFTTSKVVPLN